MGIQSSCQLPSMPREETKYLSPTSQDPGNLQAPSSTRKPPKPCHPVAWKTKEEIDKSYEFIMELGKGTSGKVWKVKTKSGKEKKLYAIKKVKLKKAAPRHYCKDYF